MNEEEAELWGWFKGVVMSLRGLNKRILKKTRESIVTIDISLIARDTDEWIQLNPFAIDLRNGRVVVYSHRGFTTIDVRTLLFTKDFGSSIIEGEYDQ